MGVEIVLQESSFDVFLESEEYLLSLEEKSAIETSFKSRLDYLNRADATLDSERRVYVAEEALKAGLELKGDTSYEGPGELDWSAG